MESQDVITYTQKIVKVIDDEKTAKVIQDENLFPVLKYLQKGPMTIMDLVSIFKKSGEEKSDKTIYRYLHTLIKVKLVAKAGKRIISITEDELKSETLYMRTAKAFIFPEALKHDKDMEKGFCPVFDATRLLLKPVLDGKTLDSDCFQKFLFKIDQERDDLLVELFKNIEDSSIQEINELNWRELDYCLNYSSWAAIAAKLNLKKELAKCK
ncbi:MAG: hypothetical protein E3J70_03855 [Candidatus Heimdallarchaeota archaeon]|nr:MAG: hypothetical protein E3J70_03855 [Candidatus Heimdallarchaeota archaeon]